MGPAVPCVCGRSAGVAGLDHLVDGSWSVFGACVSAGAAAAVAAASGAPMSPVAAVASVPVSAVAATAVAAVGVSLLAAMSVAGGCSSVGCGAWVCSSASVGGVSSCSWCCVVRGRRGRPCVPVSGRPSLVAGLVWVPHVRPRRAWRRVCK